MKPIDVWKWTEITNGQEYEAPKGSLRIMCSDPEAALYIAVEGHEILVGIGSEISCQTQEDVTFTVVCRDGYRAFVERLVLETFVPAGQTFTNADRQPNESGSVLAVRQELRSMMLQLKAERRKMLTDARKIARNAEISKVTPEPTDQQTPVPDVTAPDATDG